MLSKMSGPSEKFTDREAMYKVLAADGNFEKSNHLAWFVEERYGLNLEQVETSLATTLNGCDLETMVDWAFLSALTSVDC